MTIAWIRTVAENEATGELREMYDLARTPHGTVDNVMKAHSLRPHTMAGHLALYRSVLHHEGNTLPLWFLEAVASYTSALNRCAYSYAHHFANTCRLLGEEGRITAMDAAFRSGRPEDAFEGRELALLRYAGKLTVDVGGIEKADVDALKAAGCDDGDILEVNQVCAYFNYSNRLLNGLGVSTEGDEVGFYGEDGSGA